ncbi:MAG: AMP-binding protein [Bacteroidaceae bacterium]|nr:AMP-binding protein [Bacteroidaceae bacterium]
METAGSFNQLISDAIQKYWDYDSMSDYGVSTLQYKDVARIIEKLHILFEHSGVKPGDKVALCGKNQSRWGAAFFAITTYGAVAVPILHEFHPAQIHDIVNHSDSKLLFVEDKIFQNLDADQMPHLEGVLSIIDYHLFVSRSEKLVFARENLNRLFGEKFPMNFRKHHIAEYYHDSPDELAIINYTSGSTGNSKGVMIPYRALWSNRMFAYEVIGDLIGPHKHMLSMLPLAHTYGMAYDFIYAFSNGAHIFFLTKLASPTVLMKALADIRPSVVIVVPLIIEKVVRKAVLPKIHDPKIKILMMTPVIGDRIRKKICDGLTNALGGNFYEVIIGGSALNKEIEDVLHDIGFHYTVGYGATECSPILAYSDWKTFVPGSCGRPAPRMELRINSRDPQHVPGEILARGMNVMLGYYKNQELTDETLVDGWYHTGDLGVMDAAGNVFIKGRSKNMLLGANGQNVYPEEIEDKLAGFPLVSECVVIQKGEKFYGLVYPDPDKVKELGLSPADVEAIMEQNRKDLNQIIPNYCSLAGIRIMPEEFEKTPKKSIRRFKYMNYDVD